MAASGADIGLLAVVAAFLLPVAFSPETYHRFWAPKAAVCLLLISPGLVALVRLVRAGSRAAVAAALFVGAAGISTLFSDNPVLSLTGAANWGTGFLFVATLAAAWALGSVISEDRRRQVAFAIIVAALANAAVAWLQARGLVPPALESPERTGGLMGHPVHLGALTAGSLWLVGEWVVREKANLLWLAPLVVLAGAAQVSGGRSAAALAVVAVVGSVWRAGLESRLDRARGAAIVVAAVVGFGLGPAGAEGAALGTARAVSSEALTEEVGLRRVDVWRMSAEAVRDQPVLGWGPGRFQAATSPRYTPKVASVAAAGVLIAGELFLHHAFLDASVGSFNQAHAMLPPWPEVSHVGSRTEAFYGLHSEPHARRSLALAREGTRRDPADPSAWSYLGNIELKWGTDGAAVAAFDRALERNPWLADGLQGRARLARARGDDAAADEACRRLRILGREPPPACRPGTTRALRRPDRVPGFAVQGLPSSPRRPRCRQPGTPTRAGWP